MTRVKTSIGILAVLIIISISTGLWVNIKCRELINQTSRTLDYCINGDTEAAEKSAAELEENIESFKKTATVIIKADKLNEIDRLCSRITPLLKSGSEEITAELEELKELLTALKDGEKPVPTSIL